MGGWTRNAKGQVVYMIDLHCEQCHKPFVATRRDAKFCSVNCRKSNQRKIETIAQIAKEILWRVERLNTLAADTNKDLREKWSAQKHLKSVRDEINRIR